MINDIGYIMNYKFKKNHLIIVVITIVFLMVLAFFLIKVWLNITVEKKLNTGLPENLHIEYSDLHIEWLKGNASIQNPIIHSYSKDSLYYTKIKLEKISISGFDYFSYFTKKEIHISNITLKEPTIYEYSNPRNNNVCKKIIKKPEFSSFTVDELTVQNGEVYWYERPTNTLKLNIKKLNIKIIGLGTDHHFLLKKIPFYYRDINASFKESNFALNEFENLTIDSLNFDKKNVLFKKIEIKNKYNKHVLSNKLYKERDHISLSIPILELYNYQYSNNEISLFFTADSSKITQPVLELYRDKLVLDNETYKPLYGKMLQQLNFNIDIPKIRITDGFVGYEELVNPQTEPGRIYFDNINMWMSLSNLKRKNETIKVTSKASFMGETDVTLDFKTNATYNNFTVSGNFKNFTTKSINSFLENNLRSRAKGKVIEAFFTISGNDKRSIGDIKMKYQDFEFVILKKDSLKINKTLTAIANLFVNDGSKTDDNGYRFGKIKVERDQTKSFFNFLWISIRNGLKDVVSGNGKK